MSLDLDELAADALEMENDLPVTFTFSGTSYTGQQGDLTKESQMEDAGMMPTLDLLLVVRRTVFGAATQPVSKNTVTIASVVYRIEVVRLSQDGIIAEYGLKKKL
jgi:hypothetical protein